MINARIGFGVGYLVGLILLGETRALAQTATVSRDDGRPQALYTQAGFEESVILEPDGPCDVLALEIYFASQTPGSDTIWIVGDPSAGAVPPTSWVWSYNTLIDPIIVQHDGVPGWKSYDLSDARLSADGHERIVVQHRLDPGGLSFVFDASAQTAPYGSFVMNPTVNNSLGFPGQFSLAQGDFLVRLRVRYDYPEGEGSADPPTPTMVDVTEESRLLDADGELVRSARIGAVDIDGDGWDDVVAGSRFWRNMTDGTFALLDLGISASTSVWADIDNDGDLDCYAVRGGENPDVLWRNDGNFTFVDITESAGIDNPRPAITPIFFDCDLDGDLDLFVSNGRTGSFPDEVFYQDRLYLNDGTGRFTDVTATSGIPDAEPSPHFDAWGSAAGDYDNDGDLDIFVASYRLAPDQLYRNNTDGTLTDVARTAGVHGEPTTDSRYFGHGIGAEFVDFDNDGDLDIAVGNLGHPDWRGQVSNPSLLYRNDGGAEPTFTEIGSDVGLKFFELNSGLVWGDLDLDGYQDLLHTHLSYRREGEQGEPARLSRLYLSGGPEAEWRLIDRTWHTGLRIHGAWTATRFDFDRDGDLDLLVASSRENLKLYRNDLERKGTAILLRVVGDPSASIPLDGIGARAVVHAGDQTYVREHSSAGTGATGTQHSSAMHFGIGDVDGIPVDEVDSVVVTWGRNVRNVFSDVATGAEYRIDLGAGTIEEIPVDRLSVEEEKPEADSAEVLDVRFREDRSLVLRLPTEDTGRFPLRIVATDGRPVFEGFVTFGLGSEAVLLLPEGLGSGHYLVGLSIESRSITGRFEVE